MVYKRGKRGTWWYRFRFGGRIYHESTKTQSKTLARQGERQRRRELELKWNHIEKRTLPPKFEKAGREWLESRKDLVAANTLSIGTYSLKHLVRAFRSKLLCDIGAKHVTAYQAKRRREGAEGRTINIEVGVLRQILAMYKLWDSLAGDVRALPERRDIGRALTEDEEQRLLLATQKTDSVCHTATVLALNTAMRKNELRLLQWKQIDWKERTVTVGKSKTAAGTGRVIPLNRVAFEALVRWAGHFPQAKPEHYLFPWRENGRVIVSRPVSSWRKAWRNALKRAGVKCRFHDLRVTAITKLSESQASEQTIMAIAGHVSRRMLEHYSRIRMAAKRSALDGLAKAPITAVSTVVSSAGVHQNGNQIH